MIKLVFCLRRLPHLSREEFQRYWRDTHGPLVRRHAKTLRIRRYTQVHTLDHPVNQALQSSRTSAEPYDGVAELWWDSLSEMASALSAADARRASEELLIDERRFIDHAQSALWIGEERNFVDEGQ